MDKIQQVLVYGGTTEGRRLAGQLCSMGLWCTVCVATEYGESVLKQRQGLSIRQGRMDAAQMKQLIDSLCQESSLLAVVDATHPYAVEASANIKKSMAESMIPLLRLKRSTDSDRSEAKRVRWFSDAQACANALRQVQGNILLTTGSKELAVFAAQAYKERLYVRILPSMESLASCEALGISGRQLIAMQGPFCEQLNEALLAQFQITCLVTKESGTAGGYKEKIRAADKKGILTYVIGKPDEEEGLEFADVLQKICRLAQCDPPNALQEALCFSLLGVGMGGREGMSVQACQALEQAQLVFGARRLLEQLPGDRECYPYYLAEDILPVLYQAREEGRRIQRVAVLFSGDTGCYSGAQKLYQALSNEIQKQEQARHWTVQIYPGISSLSYLSARLGVSWQDTVMMSLHGKKLQERKGELICKLQQQRSTFLLLSGAEDVRQLGGLLVEQKMEQLTLHIGYELSYPQEKIWHLSAQECLGLTQEGLYCCLIENPKPVRGLTHGMPDDDFIRGRVPMTKEEIRQISIAKLRLRADAVLYDIGSGTGSIAVECALLSTDIFVYAVEKKPEAAALIRQNQEKHGAYQLSVIEADAPEGLRSLPTPTHALIGGSGGRLREILEVLYQKNPTMRVVMNAVTLETLSQMLLLRKYFPITEEEIVQVQVSRAKGMGKYHLMQAENPVYILSFCFTDKRADRKIEKEQEYEAAKSDAGGGGQWQR